MMHDLKIKRIAAGLTQKELAEKSGITTATISHIENATNGTRPRTQRDIEQALKEMKYDILEQQKLTEYNFNELDRLYECLSVCPKHIRKKQFRLIRQHCLMLEKKYEYDA